MFILEVKKNGTITDSYYDNAPLRAIIAQTKKIKVDNVHETIILANQTIILDYKKDSEEQTVIEKIEDNFIYFETPTIHNHGIGYTIHIKDDSNMTHVSNLIDAFPMDLGYPCKNRDNVPLMNRSCILLQSGELKKQAKERKEIEDAKNLKKQAEETVHTIIKEERIEEGEAIYNNILDAHLGIVNDAKLTVKDLEKVLEYLGLKTYRIKLKNVENTSTLKKAGLVEVLQQTIINTQFLESFQAIEMNVDNDMEVDNDDSIDDDDI